MSQRLDGHVDSSGECADIRAQLGIYVFGAITPADRATVVRHLTTCPNCRDSRMLLSKLETERSGFGTRTFECQKCGRVQTTVVSSDPMTSEARGWLAGELKPPT